MSETRLVHDAAWAMAKRVIRTLSARLREEERVQSFEEVYAALKTELAAFVVRRERERSRVRPQHTEPGSSDAGSQDETSQ